MSDVIDLNWIGARLRAIQAEQRSLHGENELIRRELGRMAGSIVTREMLSDVLTVVVERIANFEALLESRIELVESHISGLDQRTGTVERVVDGIARSNARIEQVLTEIAGRLAP